MVNCTFLSVYSIYFELIRRIVTVVTNKNINIINKFTKKQIWVTFFAILTAVYQLREGSKLQWLMMIKIQKNTGGRLATKRLGMFIKIIYN